MGFHRRFVSIILVGLNVCALSLPTSAKAETLTIECLRLFVEKDQRALLMTRDEQTYRLDGENQENHLAFTNLQRDLHKSPLRDAKIAQLLSFPKEDVFFDLLARADRAFGSNSLSEAEKTLIAELRKELEPLFSSRDAQHRRKEKELRGRSPKLTRDQLPILTQLELERDPDYVWRELQIQKRKAELVELYSEKLQLLGIDLYGPLAHVKTELSHADPFAFAGIEPLRFAFRRGERIELRKNPNYLRKKFEKHEHEFEPPLTSLEDYWTRAVTLAESTDPALISFEVPTRNGEGPTTLKYDPVNHELLVVGRKTSEIVTYFQVNRGDPATRVLYVLRRAFEGEGY